MRITITSDTHLSPRVSEAQENWDAVVRHVAANRPNLVLHLGDLSFDGAGEVDDLHHARSQLDRLPVPWHVVPGNHDLGDNPSPGAALSDLISDARRARWLDIIGPDHWRLRGDGWTLLAINAQLFDSGLPAEEAQWRWLEDALAESATSGDHLALLTHKPLAASDAELAAAPPYRFSPPAARLRALRSFDSRRLALVVSGHVHQYRLLDSDGTRHLWAPTTWAVLSEDMQPTLGIKRCGIISIELGPDGAVEPERIEPEGMVQHMLGQAAAAAPA